MTKGDRERQIKALNQCISELRQMQRHLRTTLSWHPERLNELQLTCRALLATIHAPSLVFSNDFQVIWDGMKSRDDGDYERAFAESIAVLRACRRVLSLLGEEDK